MANDNSTLRIEVKNVKKTFKIYYDKGSTLKEKMLFWKRNRYEIRNVIDDVSFTINNGEVVGLIGKNGCGKSTMLKMITGIYFCNGGYIKTYGRVSSLIELGAGFHPDMSGRENIYINAAIYGLKKKEIDTRIDDIIKFSELQDFIDQPVRTYSSGMFMRLAFSVAINVNADILLIDEILAVGDSSFQSKCFKKLADLKKQGVTIIIVTHDINTIQSFCNRVIWINNGKVSFDGDVIEGAHRYMEYLEDLDAKKMLDSTDKQNLAVLSAIKTEEELKKVKEKELEKWKHRGNNKGKITDCYLLNKNNEKTLEFDACDPMIIHIEYELYEDLSNCIVGMGFNQLDSAVVYGTNTQIDDYPVESKKGKYTIEFNIKSLPLVNGTYYLNVTIIEVDEKPIDYHNAYLKFKISKTSDCIGQFSMEHSWNKK